MQHRGPDASHQWASPDGAVALGSVRLRIIDLSPEGDMPMPNEDETVWVAFNGELYNHQELRSQLLARGHTFRSATDTETIVHAYEEHADDPVALLERLRGMFAIAVYDIPRARLLLARDRLGIKPLYVAQTPAGGVAFGSEARTVARMLDGIPSVDRQSVAHYLLRGVIPGPRTIFDGVRELEPGSLMTWTHDEVRERRWWTPRFEPQAMSADESVEVLRPALHDAVQRHLVADRPVGVFLSSGVDSGSVATMAAARGTVRTFTVTFPDLGNDEADAARALAASLGADHAEVGITSEEAGRAIPGILADMDQPTHDGVNSWLVSRAARQAGLVVALSGLGGDEVFGGYHTFSMVPKVARMRAALSVVPISVRRRMSLSAGMRTPGGRAARVWASDPGFLGAYRAVRGYFAPPEVGDVAWPTDRIPDTTGLAPADAVSLFEMTYYLADQTLRDTDQMSMAHSLEVRVPLLDDEVVATALRIPASLRTRTGKALLSEAAGLHQVHPKLPFALPFDRWMQGPLREMVREGLLSEELPFADIIPGALRHRLWDHVERGGAHWSRPWGIAVIRLWPGENGLRW